MSCDRLCKLIILYMIFSLAMGALVFWPRAGEGVQPAVETALADLETALPCHTMRHINGLLETGYDTDHNGRANIITLTRPNGAGGYLDEPLFYGVDENEDGLWEAVYIDIEEDGLNGNETLYQEALFKQQPRQPGTRRQSCTKAW